MKNSRILIPTLPLCASCCAYYNGVFDVVVVAKLCFIFAVAELHQKNGVVHWGYQISS
jgi:uncharacterized membrane protein